jgi:hypothetical protein
MMHRLSPIPESHVDARSSLMKRPTTLAIHCMPPSWPPQRGSPPNYQRSPDQVIVPDPGFAICPRSLFPPQWGLRPQSFPRNASFQSLEHPPSAHYAHGAALPDLQIVLAPF